MITNQTDLLSNYWRKNISIDKNVLVRNKHMQSQYFFLHPILFIAFQTFVPLSKSESHDLTKQNSENNNNTKNPSPMLLKNLPPWH